jgi:hypothetical protein
MSPSAFNSVMMPCVWPGNCYYRAVMFGPVEEYMRSAQRQAMSWC